MDLHAYYRSCAQCLGPPWIKAGLAGPWAMSRPITIYLKTKPWCQHMWAWNIDILWRRLSMDPLVIKECGVCCKTLIKYHGHFVQLLYIAGTVMPPVSSLISAGKKGNKFHQEFLTLSLLIPWSRYVKTTVAIHILPPFCFDSYISPLHNDKEK